MTNSLELFAQTVVAGNLLLVQGLGLYGLLRHTKSVKDAGWMGLSTFTSLILGGALLWLLQGIQPLSSSVTVGFYLVLGVIAALASYLLLGKKFALEEVLLDSALIGLLLLLGQDGVVGAYNLWIPLGAGLGYALVLVVMATLRQRLELAPVPKAFKGAPILLITAGLLAIALLGFRF